MVNRYHATRFLRSASELDQLPADNGREVAFAGRSNAGKSSALNALSGQHRLARTSKTPGRTQLLNYFEVAPERYLVDLPGYGYARVAETLRQHWQQVMARYLSERSALVGLILLMDIRHPLTALDRQLLDWSTHRMLAVHILLTKTDKLRRGPALTIQRQVTHALTAYPQASVQLFSAMTGDGLEQLRQQLDAWLFPTAEAS